MLFDENENCDFCNTPLPSSNLRQYIHFTIDITFTLLVFCRLGLWMMCQNVFLGKMRSFPCTCGHTMFWHIPSFDISNIDKLGGSLTPMSLFFKLRFKKRGIDEYNGCLTCALSEIHFRGMDTPKCTFFKRVNNLDYINGIFKKHE